MLNGLWLGFFIVAAVSALAQWLIGGNAGIFAAMVESIFAMAKLSVEVMVLLFGTLTLWLGFLRIAEKAGIVDWLAKALGPLFLRLMPEVPPGHPAIGLITLNFAANALGPKCDRRPFSLDAVFNQHFEIDHFQDILFVTESFEQLFQAVEEAGRRIGTIR